MAKRRMFSLDIVDSDTFLDLSATAQLLYFHLGMRADDRGYISKPRAIIKMCNCSLGDLETLINKKFVLLRDNGLILIKGWKINNCIQPTRLVETTYTEDLMKLFYDENNSYTEKPTNTPVLSGCQQLVNNLSTQDSIDKNSIEKDNLLPHTCVREEEEKSIPTLDEVISFCKENNFNINPYQFFNYYNSLGWKINGQPIKDWKVLLRTWYSNNNTSTSSKHQTSDTEWLPDYVKHFEETVEDL